MIPKRITVDGYDGSGPEDPGLDTVRLRIRADLDRMFPDGWHDRDEANDPEVRKAAVDRFQYHLFVPTVVKLHNDAVPAAEAYLLATRLAARAVIEVDSLYADLNKSTTVNWLAAHHRFILAAVEARRLLTEAAAAAAALRDGEFGRQMKDLCAVYYEQVVPAGQRIAVPDVDAAELELAEFVETTRERLDILRATVSGGYPAGFAPLPAGPAPAPAGPVGDDWAAEQQAGPGVVVAGRGRGW